MGSRIRELRKKGQVWGAFKRVGDECTSYESEFRGLELTITRKGETVLCRWLVDHGTAPGFNPLATRSGPCQTISPSSKPHAE